MTNAVIPRWSRREPPLPAVAVIGRGSVALTLAAAAAGGVGLRAAAGHGWLLVLGDSADLPWADGAFYLGSDDGLLLPTTARVNPPAALVRRAALRRAPAGCGIVILLPAGLIVSPVPAGPVDPAALAGALP